MIKFNVKAAQNVRLILGLVVTLTLASVSFVWNFTTGFSSGENFAQHLLFGLVGGSSVVLKALLPFGIRHAFNQRKYGAVGIGLLLLACAFACSYSGTFVKMCTVSQKKAAPQKRRMRKSWVGFRFGNHIDRSIKAIRAVRSVASDKSEGKNSLTVHFRLLRFRADLARFLRFVTGKSKETVVLWATHVSTLLFEILATFGTFGVWLLFKQR